MAKEVLETGTATFGTGVGAVVYDITDLSYDVAHGSVDSNDTGTTAGESEAEVLRAKRTFSFTMFMDVAAADPPTGVEHELILDFEGKTRTGNAVIDTQGDSGSLDGMITQVFSGYFNGAMVVA
jgi:hypothetical protein